MKKIIISLLVGLSSMSVFGQEDDSPIFISNVYEFVKPEITIPLPFSFNNRLPFSRMFSQPDRSMYFVEGFVYDDIELPIANNIHLNSFFYLLRRDSLNPEIGGHGWEIRGKLPTPDNSEYITVFVSSSSCAYTSAGFVTLDKDDHAIDKLIAYSEMESKMGLARYREFTVDKDTIISVYTIRCVKPKSSPAWYLGKGESFYGQRTDSRYKISHEGKFEEIEKVEYRPQRYRKSKFSEKKDYIISNGDEKPLK